MSLKARIGRLEREAPVNVAIMTKAQLLNVDFESMPKAEFLRLGWRELFAEDDGEADKIDWDSLTEDQLMEMTKDPPECVSKIPWDRLTDRQLELIIDPRRVVF